MTNQATLVFTFISALALSPAPQGQAFYDPPSPLTAGKPGDVIWARPLDSGAALRDAASNILVLYHTRTAQGRDIAISGTIAIPKGAPPPGGWPVISWAHGTTGNGPQCAPSRTPKQNGEQRMLESWAAQGYAVLQTDYEGNGTPGVHPYFVGAAAVHDVTDIIRAARNLDPDIGNRWLAMGHSEGGNAALFVAARAQAWAPELRLLGSVVYAPGSYIIFAVQNAIQSSQPLPTLPLPLMMVQGMVSADPKLSLSDILTPLGIAKLTALQGQCIGDALRDPAWTSAVPSSLFRHDTDVLPLAHDLAANDAVWLHLSVPALLLQGAADNVVSAKATTDLARELCSTGATLTLSLYSGDSHASILSSSLKEAQAWVAARFAGEAAASSCGRL